LIECTYVRFVVGQCIQVVVHSLCLLPGQLVLNVLLVFRHQLLAFQRRLVLQRLVRLLKPLQSRDTYHVIDADIKNQQR